MFQKSLTKCLKKFSQDVSKNLKFTKIKLETSQIHKNIKFLKISNLQKSQLDFCFFPCDEQL